MALLDFIFRRTPAESDPPPPIVPTPEAAVNGAIVIVVDDAEADHLPEFPPSTPVPDEESCVQYVLEPYFAMIEYTDAQGAFSRRRITMRSITEFKGVRTLQAMCHERHAIRNFRLDRISCLISQDGEVEAAAPWFDHIVEISESRKMPAPQIFGKGGSRARPDEPSKTKVSPYTALRREISPGLMFLVASARSDDFLHPRELDRILRYAEDEMVILREEGRIPGGAEAEAFDKLDRTIRRLRPTREDLGESAERLAAWPLPRMRRLAHALADTARADGRIDQTEAALVDELCSLGTRKHGFGWDDAT